MTAKDSHTNRRRSVYITTIALGLMAVSLLVALRVILDQRKTIADFRDQTATEMPETEPSGPTAAAESAPEPASDIGPAVTSLPPAATPVPTATPSPELEQWRQQYRVLEPQVAHLESQLAEALSRIPEPDDPKAAYVGPGTWIEADSDRKGPAKIVISGQLPEHGQESTMTINMWGHCHLQNCEWGEVPFVLLNDSSGGPVYRRGFATWDLELFTAYLIVTFEKNRLRTECVEIFKPPSYFSRRTVGTLTRIFGR